MDFLRLFSTTALARLTFDSPAAKLPDVSGRKSRPAFAVRALVFLVLFCSLLGGRAFASGPLLISEFRLRGPSGANDEYVEIYNKTAAAITVEASDSSAGFALVAATGVTVFIIPNGTVIPAHGHYLGTNTTAYSLASYPAGSGTTATGDITWTADIPDNTGLALFNSSTTFTLANELDAAGPTTAPALYREGAGLPPLTPFSINYAWYRFQLLGTASTDDTSVSLADGQPRDTGDNASDFAFVDTNGTSAGGGQRLGAPGPKNLSSPVAAYPISPNIGQSLIDPTVSASTAPNYMRDHTSNPANNATFGTLEFDGVFTNNTGAPLTRLRFRVAKLTTFPASSGIADLRPYTSADGPAATAGGPVAVLGTTLEQPPSQPNGGGWNSTLSVPSVTAGTPLAIGASVNVRALFGIQQTGAYCIAFLTEGSPSASQFFFFTGNTEGAPVVAGTMAAAGSFASGSTVTYTVVLANSGNGSQPDNPGNEFVDVLPSGLALLSATASSGTAVATVGTNTVNWDGVIPAAGSATITITATIVALATTSIINQGTINYDAQGNGTNLGTALTNDPSVIGTANPTSFVVGVAAAPTVTGVAPTGGPTGGGTSVVVTGTNFTGTTTVTFGANPALTFVMNSPTSITVPAPAGSPGVVDISVTTPGGTSAASANDRFTYASSAPPPIPEISGAGTVYGTINQSVGYTISASNSPTSYGATGLPSWLNINPVTGAITGTPTANGVFSFTISATNSYGTGVATLFVIVGQTAQTITFTQPSDVTVTSPPFALSASASSGLPVSFAITSGPATVSGANVTLTGGTGTVTVQASQAGNGAFSAAPSLTLSFQVDATGPITQSAPRTFFGSFATATGQSAAVQLRPEAATTSIAATVNAANTAGTLIGYIASLNAGFVANFTVGGGGVFQTSTTTIVTGSNPTQTLTINGTLGSTTLTGSIAGLGLTFSLAVDPATGPSSGVTGFYNTASLQSSSGGTYSVVGSQNDIYVLVVLPSLISFGAGLVTASDGFSVQGTSSATIAGSIDPTTTGITGTVTTPTLGTTTFSGVASTTTLTDRLVNFSALGKVTPANSLTAGLVIAGTTSKTLVIRAVGPGLAAFGLSGVLAHPQLTLLDGSGSVLATNAVWGGSTALTTAFSQAGAFALASASADSAVSMSLAPGSYTMRVSDAANDAGGIVLAEVYDASIDPTGVTQKLVNFSCMGQAGAGNNVLECGFVVSGDSPKRILIRGVGPSLAAFGVSGAIADPMLNVYDSSGDLLATNNDWGTPILVNPGQITASAAQLSAAENQAAAFPLQTGSKDAALIITLTPGAYTAQVTNASGISGTALVEIYELSQ